MPHHQEHYTAGQTERVPTFLTLLEPVESDQVVRVVPDQLGVFERNAVAHEISPSLVRIPLEPRHRSCRLVPGNVSTDFQAPALPTILHPNGRA